MRPDQLAPFIRGLAHPTRLKIVALLAESANGLQAGDIARRLSLPKSTLSAHLARLAESGLVSGDREGRNITYRIDTPMSGLFMTLIRDLLGQSNRDAQKRRTTKPASVVRDSF
jgi:ArsR family transcriptional regulator, arsenate/arsenite/antimonite-responsive transcriptional repressor